MQNSKVMSRIFQGDLVIEYNTKEDRESVYKTPKF